MMPQPRYLPAILVTFSDDMPEEVRSTIEAFVMANLDILPAWTTQLHVYWERELSMAEVKPRPDYRRASMAVGAGWLEASDSYRRRVIVHELAHVQLAPLHIFAAHLCDLAGKDNPALDAEIREQLRVALEQTTSDVEDLLLRLIDRGDGKPQQGPLRTSAGSFEHGFPMRLGADDVTHGGRR